MGPWAIASYLNVGAIEHWQAVEPEAALAALSSAQVLCEELGRWGAFHQHMVPQSGRPAMSMLEFKLGGQLNGAGTLCGGSMQVCGITFMQLS